MSDVTIELAGEKEGTAMKEGLRGVIVKTNNNTNESMNYHALHVSVLVDCIVLVLLVAHGGMAC
jgi:hypothetical protein